MTHDELLSLLTATPGHSPWAHFFKKPNSVMLALRAVVELHRPDGSLCLECTHNFELIGYPCDTILAIEKELG